MASSRGRHPPDPVPNEPVEPEIVSARVDEGVALYEVGPDLSARQVTCEHGVDLMGYCSSCCGPGL